MAAIRAATTAFALQLGLVLTGCGSQFSSSGSLPAGAHKVEAVNALFDPSPPDNIAITAPAATLEIYKVPARDSAQQLFALYEHDFRTHFPAFAAAAGLAVSPTATDELRVSVTGAETRCSSVTSCVAFLQMKGELLDERGRTVWSFTSRVGGSAGNTTFEEFSRRLLEAMNRDGVIGK